MFFRQKVFIASLFFLLTLLMQTVFAQTFIVNTSLYATDVHLGDGVCDIDEGSAGSQYSLRAAITEANARPGKDIVSFNTPALESRSLALLSPMVEIIDPVIINGTDQPGFAGVSLIELDGSLSDPRSPGSIAGLVVSCGDSEIRGIVVNSGVSNAVLSNRIFSNIGPGIDLGKDFGVTPNDPGDEDEGANHFQNFPQILSFADNDIHGAINTTPLSEILIQCFINTACYFSGYGQGEVLAGQTTITIDVNGNADFTIPSGTALLPGNGIAATATQENSTSEFSWCFQIPGLLQGADLDQYQDTDDADIAILALNFNRTDCSVQMPCPGDIDDNHSVDHEDLRLFCLQMGS